MPWFERDGARIHYEEHGSGDPLLLLHGFTDSARELSGLIGALAPYYRVIAPDLRGYGRSEPRPRNVPPRLSPAAGRPSATRSTPMSGPHSSAFAAASRRTVPIRNA